MVHCSGTSDTIDNRGVIMWCLVIIIVTGIQLPAYFADLPGTYLEHFFAAY